MLKIYYCKENNCFICESTVYGDVAGIGDTEEEALNPDKNNINSSLTANYRSLGLDYKIIPIRKIF